MRCERGSISLRAVGCAALAASAFVAGSSGCASLLDLDVTFVDAETDGAADAPSQVDTGAGGRDSAADAGRLPEAGGRPDADATTPASDARVDGTGADAPPPADVGATMDVAATMDVSPPDEAGPLEAAADDGMPLSSDAYFVQAEQVQVGSQPSVAVSLLDVTAGNTLVVGVSYDASGAAALTDSQGDTFTLAASAGTTTAIYYAVNVRGGSHEITVAPDALAAGYLEIIAVEYTHLGPVDVWTGATGTDLHISSGSATTTVAGDLLVGYSVASSVTPVDFTVRADSDGDVLADGLSGAPGSYSFEADQPRQFDWTALFVAFQPR